MITVYRVEVELGQLGDAMDTVQRCMELGERGGFAYAGIATRADLARVIAYLGDGERALALADEALAIALERVPPAASLAHVARADALIALGRHMEAHAPLDEVDLMMLPEPDPTSPMVAARTIRSRLALVDGDVDGAEAIARGLVDELRTDGVVVLEAEAHLALARPTLPPTGSRRPATTSLRRSRRRNGSGSVECSGRRWRCPRTCTLGSMPRRRRAISVAERARSSRRSLPDSPRRTFGSIPLARRRPRPRPLNTDGDAGGTDL